MAKRDFLAIIKALTGHSRRGEKRTKTKKKIERKERKKGKARPRSLILELKILFLQGVQDFKVSI